MSPDHGLLEVLTRHGVPFVVIGGHAVCAHGYLRSTEDTDVLWLRSPASEAALLHALEELAARGLASAAARPSMARAAVRIRTRPTEGLPVP